MVEQFLDAAAAPPPRSWTGWRASVTFPNAMVDRIVPGTTDETRADVRRILGVDDAVPVPAEAFTMWVIEDRLRRGPAALGGRRRHLQRRGGGLRAGQAPPAQRLALPHLLPRRPGRPRDHPGLARPGLRRGRGARRDRRRVPAQHHPAAHVRRRRVRREPVRPAGPTPRWATGPRGSARTARPSCSSACPSRPSACWAGQDAPADGPDRRGLDLLRGAARRVRPRPASPTRCRTRPRARLASDGRRAGRARARRAAVLHGGFFPARAHRPPRVRLPRRRPRRGDRHPRGGHGRHRGARAADADKALL